MESFYNNLSKELKISNKVILNILKDYTNNNFEEILKLYIIYNLYKSNCLTYIIKWDEEINKIKKFIKNKEVITDEANASNSSRFKINRDIKSK